VELDPAQQDDVLAAVESGKAEGWPAGGVGAAVFFGTVRSHTIIGFLADPKYGGNRDYAGWKVAGYPGGGHHLGGYSPEQMIGNEKIKTVWGDEV
jgi:gluconate 2-dehydrogenase gamma chain